MNNKKKMDTKAIEELAAVLPERRFYDFERPTLGNDLRKQFQRFMENNNDLEMLKAIEKIHVRTDGLTDHEGAALKVGLKKWLKADPINELTTSYIGSPHEFWAKEKGLKVFVNDEIVRVDS